MNPIVRYAQLQIMGQRLYMARKPIPPALIREVQELEAWAQSTFPPDVVNRMVGMVQETKAKMLASEMQEVGVQQERMAAQSAALRQHNADTLARKIGRNAGLDVRNVEEFTRLRKGLPLKRGTPKPTPVDPQALEQATIEATKHLDANGEGFTPKQWRNKLEHLWEYAGTHQWSEQCRRVGLRPSRALKDAMTRYQEQEMVERLSGPKKYGEYEVKTTDKDHRRAVIATAMAEELARSGSERELDEFHRRPDYLRAKEIVEDKYGYEGDSVRKDVAKALIEHYDDEPAPEHTPTYEDTPDVADEISDE
jgi:hypothetical protein